MLPTGLRGVGKTVLLNRFVAEAQRQGYLVAQLEASDSENFINLLASRLRGVLHQLSARDRAADAVRAALRVFKSFTATFNLTQQSVTLGVNAELGKADSGILSQDLVDLFVTLGEAAREADTAVLIAIDEVQYLKQDQLEAIIMAVHRVTQLSLPVIVLGTGLPQLPALAGEAKSYAERLFDYPNLGPLSREQAYEAVRAPAREQGADFTDTALARLYEITKGYPYFIQEWAYHAWNHARQSPITLDDINAIEQYVLARLDESFFRVRFDRLTRREKRYLRAMAELNEAPYRSGDIAGVLGLKVESTGPLRSGLIKKGMIYSSQHGDNDFTVPLFADFMKRAMPDLIE